MDVAEAEAGGDNVIIFRLSGVLELSRPMIVFSLTFDSLWTSSCLLSFPRGVVLCECLGSSYLLSTSDKTDSVVCSCSVWLLWLVFDCSCVSECIHGNLNYFGWWSGGYLCTQRSRERQYGLCATLDYVNWFIWTYPLMQFSFRINQVPVNIWINEELQGY